MRNLIADCYSYAFEHSSYASTGFDRDLSDRQPSGADRNPYAHPDGCVDRPL